MVQVIQKQEYELEGLSQSNVILTSSNAGLMAHLAQMTVTMNAMQVQLPTLVSGKPTKQIQKLTTTAGIAVATTLMRGKPAYQRKRYTKRKRTKIKIWVAVKRDVNDG